MIENSLSVKIYFLSDVVPWRFGWRLTLEMETLSKPGKPQLVSARTSSTMITSAG